MLIKKAAADCKDALKLCEELSDTLESITGCGGKASFNLNDMKSKRSVFCVAYVDDMPRGCGGIKEVSQDCGEIKRVFAKLKGRGIGSAVIAFLENEAKTLEYSKLILETRKVNENAVKFYLNHGYKEIENYGKYKGRDEAICFCKVI